MTWKESTLSYGKVVTMLGVCFPLYHEFDVSGLDEDLLGESDVEVGTAAKSGRVISFYP